MDVLQQITIKQTPYIFTYDPQPLRMTAREIGALPALISELVNMSIEKVTPIECVGRVLVFEVLPYKQIDPPLIFCKALDLREYYFIWAQAIKKGFSGVRLLALYDDMIRALRIDKLRTDEAAFTMIEILKFKNEYLRRL